MNSRKVLIIVSCLLLLFLAVFTVNQRTKAVDKVTENTGLEFTGMILKFGYNIYDGISSIWHKYIDLRAVREENDVLKQEIQDLKLQLLTAKEEEKELQRLRALYNFETPKSWTKIGTRILAGRMGSNAALQSIIINRGVLTGAKPNTPVINSQGVVGRVRRAGASTSTVLLTCDPLSSISVLGEQSRSQGILFGQGVNENLELKFVAINSGLLDGELLLTSGLDNIFPKGLPVARVTKIIPSENNPFYIVSAESLVDFSKLEELLLLVPPAHYYINEQNIFVPKRPTENLVPEEAIEKEDQKVNSPG